MWGPTIEHPTRFQWLKRLDIGDREREGEWAQVRAKYEEGGQGCLRRTPVFSPCRREREKKIEGFFVPKKKF